MLTVRKKNFEDQKRFPEKAYLHTDYLHRLWFTGEKKGLWGKKGRKKQQQPTKQYRLASIFCLYRCNRHKHLWSKGCKTFVGYNSQTECPAPT